MCFVVLVSVVQHRVFLYKRLVSRPPGSMRAHVSIWKAENLYKPFLTTLFTSSTSNSPGLCFDYLLGLDSGWTQDSLKINNECAFLFSRKH